MKIEIVDDGIGAFATLNKLRYSLCADYTVELCEDNFPLGELSRSELFSVAQGALSRAVERKCDVVVFSSIALSVATAKTLQNVARLPLFGCEAPILHATTYTASQVLVVADKYVSLAAKRFPSVLSVALPNFATLAQNGADDRVIVKYLSDNLEKYSGTFDCIALGCSSMNLYKHCFSRVFPNAKIFDSLDGVARKLRKTYKKSANDECSISVINSKGEDLSQKYNFFLDELPASY